MGEWAARRAEPGENPGRGMGIVSAHFFSRRYAAGTPRAPTSTHHPRSNARLDPVPAATAGLARSGPEHRLRRRLPLSHAAADGLGARGVCAHQDQPRAVLAGDSGGHRRQHTGWRPELGHGSGRSQGGGPGPAPIHTQSPRAALAGALWPQSLPDVLAAHRGRPAVRRGRLAQISVLALPGLHGHRQVCALPHHDRRPALGVPGGTAVLHRPPHRGDTSPALPCAVRGRTAAPLPSQA